MYNNLSKIHDKKLFVATQLKKLYLTMTGKEILSELSKFPHRGATTQNEHKASVMLAKSLEEMGLDVSVEQFRATPSYSWEIILCSLTVIAGLIIGIWLSFMGAALVLLGYWSLVRHFMGRGTLFTHLIPRGSSQNVLGKIKSHGDEFKRRIILMAHYDTARASALFSPGMVKSFRKNFVFNMYLGTGAIPWAFLGQYWGNFIWYKLGTGIIGLIFFSNVLIHLHREIVHRYVQGMNDNGSGVAAVFDIINKLNSSPLLNTEVWVLFTGCEETSIQGARNFVDEHKYELKTESTYVINLDNIGQGNLHFATGEGMTIFWKYDDLIINKCASIASRPEFSGIRPLEYRLAYFDALTFAQNGYPCTTLIALDDNGAIPNWHWYTDTIENIDWKPIELAVDFSVELSRQIDAS